MKKTLRSKNDASPSQLIDARIEELGDWRGETLASVRALIKKIDPAVIEEWKWRGVPVWSHDGMICTGETYKAVVKLTFAKGAALHDPAGLFNSSLEGNTRRAIDIREGERIDEKALKGLILEAVELNGQSKRAVKKAGGAATAAVKKKTAGAATQTVKKKAKARAATQTVKKKAKVGAATQTVKKKAKVGASTAAVKKKTAKAATQTVKKKAKASTTAAKKKMTRAATQAVKKKTKA